MSCQTRDTGRRLCSGPAYFMSRSSLSSLLPAPSRVARRRVWLGRLGALGVVAVAVLLVAWAWRDDDIAPAHREDEPAFTVEHPSIVARKNGQRLWQFDAAQIEPSPDGSQTVVKNVSNGILFRGDKPFLKISAKRVRLENVANNVEATGGVQASGPDRFAVSSSVVNWNYGRKLLLCPQPVTAQLRDFHFQAPRLNYNWESGELGCNSPVELQAPGVHLKAPHLKASTKTRALELGGGVSMTFDPQTARPQKWRDLLTLPGTGTP